jgi:hypothetical protein
MNVKAINRRVIGLPNILTFQEFDELLLLRKVVAFFQKRVSEFVGCALLVFDLSSKLQIFISAYMNILVSTLLN